MLEAPSSNFPIVPSTTPTMSTALVPTNAAAAPSSESSDVSFHSSTTSTYSDYGSGSSPSTDSDSMQPNPAWGVDLHPNVTFVLAWAASRRLAQRNLNLEVAVDLLGSPPPNEEPGYFYVIVGVGGTMPRKHAS